MGPEACRLLILRRTLVKATWPWASTNDLTQLLRLLAEKTDQRN